MINIELNYSDWKAKVDTDLLSHFSYKEIGTYKLIAIDGPMVYLHELDQDNDLDYEENYLINANKKAGNYYSREPFATKVLKNGTKLFRRKHGKKETIQANTSKDIIFINPYNSAKVNKLEIIDANALDRIDLQVLDTPSGTISTIPNYMLNQFGFDVVVADLIYSDKSDYDADLIKDMQVKITYHNDSNIDKEVGFNIIFHEVV